MPLFRRRLKRQALGGEELTLAETVTTLEEPKGEARNSYPSVYGEGAKADLAIAMAEYGSRGEAAQDEEVHFEVEEAPIVRLANTVLQQAIKARASFVIVENMGRGLRVLYRTDGIMYETMTMPAYIVEPLIGRYKVMAGLSAGLRGTIQTGTILITYDRQRFNLRLTCTPTETGEKLTFQIFDVKNIRGLSHLGVRNEVKAQIEDLLASQGGLFLVTGGQANGISTTLYTLLNKLNSIESNCYAIGKPDYELGGIACINPKSLRRTTQADILHATAKQDADVILVDAPTDAETMREAVNAAENGVLVLCGMYGQGAINTLMRLPELGIEPRRIGQNVLGILAQTLVRKVCENCKEFYEEDAKNLRRFGLRLEDPEQKVTLARGRGCEVCRETGYRERFGLFELFRMDSWMQDALPKNPPYATLLEEAKANGMHELREDGLMKVLAGQTTPDEVWRTVRIH